MKQKIMEALLSADNNLTQDEIKWAAVNIPDVGIQSTYDHNAPSIWDACGITDEIMDKCKSEMTNLVSSFKEYNDVDNSKRSQIIEHLLTNGSSVLVKTFTIRGICNLLENKEESDIEKLKKLLGKYK